jgi:3-deoxy-D-manno-octulosonic-acid transferase
MWLLYELIIVLGFLLYLPKALWRRRLPHAGWSMRLGSYPAEVLAQLAGRQTLWVHAVSVGEVQAALPLVRALRERYPQAVLALSTVTKGGFAVASQVPGVVPVYCPLDLRWAVDRALNTLRPKALLLVESELWPQLIRLTHSRGIPIVVVNGRISDRAFPRYQAFRRLLQGTLQRVDAFLMQAQVDADRVLALGASAAKVQVIGSLKWDASLSTRPSPESIQTAREALALAPDDPVLVAGSTHRGEEAAVLAAFAALHRTNPRARLIVAPRHLERLDEVDHLARQAGWHVTRLPAGPGGQPWDVGLIETFGQLPRYYALASLVYIGGSLIPHGGQNPLEAASLARPIIFGPHMHNFAAIAHQLLAHHAARQVERAEALPALCEALLAHPEEARTMGLRAQALTEQFQGATQRTLRALGPLLKGSAEWPVGYG